MQTTLARSAFRPALKQTSGRRVAGGVTAAPRRSDRRTIVSAGLDTNFFVNAIESAAAITIPVAVSIVTAEKSDDEFVRTKSVEGLIPIGAAVAADAVAHSIPGLNVLFSLAAEPAGAAAGVAYLMSVLLAAPAVDPQTLAPKGTVLNAEKALDARGAVRVPFTRILPTALKVVDTSNSGYTGAGWKAGADGLPKLPLNSVLIVVGVGGLILEAAAHAPVLSLFMPRVLQVAGWLALAGYALDKRE